MSKLIRLIQNEQIKLYSRAGTWVMIALLFLVVLIAGIISKYLMPEVEQVDWRADLIASNQHFDEIISENNLPDQAVSYYERERAINQYRLDYDIPPVQNHTLWGFMHSTTDLFIMIALFTIIIAAGMVASEYSWGTIKLLLLRPVTRSTILLSKYLATFIFALTSLFLLFLFSLITGAVLFGLGGFDLPHLAYVQGEVVEKGMITHIFQQYGLSSIDLVMMTTFAFMISTVFRSSSLAIGLSIFLTFTGSQVSFVLSRYDWAKYILFSNTDLRQYIDGVPIVEGMTMGFSLTILAIYFLIFISLSWLIFCKRDITA